MTSVFYRNIIIPVVVGTIVLAVFCYSQAISEYIEFDSSSQKIRFYLELATNKLTRAKGLMNRLTLANDQGMLFVFDEAVPQTFWMKNTLIPLDIIFLDSNLVIVDIQENAQPCRQDPCPTYSSRYPAQYVLEIKGGQTREKQLQLGNQAYWHRSLMASLKVW